MNRFIQFPLLLLLTLFAVGCKTSLDVVSERSIQKRKYRPGFFVAHPSNTHAKSHADQPLRANNASTIQAPADELITEELMLNTINTSLEASPVQTPMASPRPETVSRPQPRQAKAASTYESSKPTALDRSDQRISTNPFTHINLNAEQHAADDLELVIYILLSFLLPPLAVFLLYGISTEFWISILLTLLLWLPGVVYALIHVIRRMG